MIRAPPVCGVTATRTKETVPLSRDLRPWTAELGLSHSAGEIGRGVLSFDRVRRSVVSTMTLAIRLALAAVVALLAVGTALSAPGGTLPSGFQDTAVLSGLVNPTAVRFAVDGRVFVAQKDGLIKVFNSVSATTGTTFADLRPAVDDYWDRGLLGASTRSAVSDAPIRVCPVLLRCPPRFHRAGVERRVC